MKLCMSLTLALTCCGCSAVYTHRPVGLTATDITAEAAEWEGTWVHPEGAFSVLVEDGSNGLIQAAWVERGGGALKHKSATVHLRDAGGWTFASAQAENEDDLYVWGRIEKEKRSALIWLPDVAKFKALIESGTLPGVTNGSNVILGDLSTNDFDNICSDSKQVLFDWDKPLVLWKTSE